MTQDQLVAIYSAFVKTPIVAQSSHSAYLLAVVPELDGQVAISEAAYEMGELPAGNWHRARKMSAYDVTGGIDIFPDESYCYGVDGASRVTYLGRTIDLWEEHGVEAPVYAEWLTVQKEFENRERAHRELLEKTGAKRIFYVSFSEDSRQLGKKPEEFLDTIK
jgi:hypothetical protein